MWMILVINPNQSHAYTLINIKPPVNSTCMYDISYMKREVLKGVHNKTNTSFFKKKRERMT